MPIEAARDCLAGSEKSCGIDESLRWEAIINTIKQMKSLKPDWDGEGSPAPTRKSVDCAEVVATVLMAIGSDPADRVFADQNGSICMEFIQTDRYIAIEIDRRRNVSFWMSRRNA